MTELLGILWQPKRAADRVLTSKVKLFSTVLAWLIVDLAASLMLFPLLTDALSKAMAMHPEFRPGTRFIVFVIAMTVTVLFNFMFSSFAALVLYFSTIVFGGRSSYRKVLEVVLIGSAPTLFYRGIRALLYATKITSTIRQNALPIRDLLPNSLHVLATTIGRIDLVDLWSLGLIAYGFSRVSGLRWWVSAAVVLALWIGMQALVIRAQMSGGF